MDNTTTPIDSRQRVIERLADDTGATAIEYGLLAALIAIAALAAISATGDQLERMYVYWSSLVASAL